MSGRSENVSDAVEAGEARGANICKASDILPRGPALLARELGDLSPGRSVRSLTVEKLCEEFFTFLRFAELISGGFTTREVLFCWEASRSSGALLLYSALSRPCPLGCYLS